MKKLLMLLVTLGTIANLLLVLVDLPQIHKRADFALAERAKLVTLENELSAKRLAIREQWKKIPHKHDWKYFSNSCDRPGCCVVHYPYYECRKCGKHKTAESQNFGYGQSWNVLPDGIYLQGATP